LTGPRPSCSRGLPATCRCCQAACLASSSCSSLLLLSCTPPTCTGGHASAYDPCRVGRRGGHASACDPCGALERSSRHWASLAYQGRASFPNIVLVPVRAGFAAGSEGHGPGSRSEGHGMARGRPRQQALCKPRYRHPELCGNLATNGSGRVLDNSLHHLAPASPQSPAAAPPHSCMQQRMQQTTITARYQHVTSTLPAPFVYCIPNSESCPHTLCLRHTPWPPRCVLRANQRACPVAVQARTCTHRDDSTQR
jgi:hypothetical protein